MRRALRTTVLVCAALVAAQPERADLVTTHNGAQIVRRITALEAGRITVVTSGTEQVIEQIKAQLGRLVPVHKVHDLTAEGPHVERELALVKVVGTGDKRVESLRIADVFRTRVIDSTTESFVFEITGSQEKVNAFIALMTPLGLVEVSRTGIVAISRGTAGF